MSENKKSVGERKADEEQLDDTIEDTFPASDPPANTPVEGTRKAEQQRDAPKGKAPK